MMSSETEKRSFLALRCPPLFEARLWWKIASKTKLLVSVTFSGTQKKVSRTSVPNYDKHNERDWEDEGKHRHSRSSRQWSRKRGGSGDACYLCSIKYTNLDTRPPIPVQIHHYDETTHTKFVNTRINRRPNTPNITIALSNADTRPSYRFLPLAHTQRPHPPRRSTSLPHYLQLQKLHLSTTPQYALRDYPLSSAEGQKVAYLATTSIDGLTSRTPAMEVNIWRYILQVSASEPIIRALALKLASISQSQSQSFEDTNLTFKSNTSPKRIGINSLGTREWEICFLATFLLANLQSLTGNKRTSRCWARRGYHILRAAMRKFCPGDRGGDGHALPSGMRDIALAFARMGI